MNSTTAPKWETELKLAVWNQKVQTLSAEMRLAGWHGGLTEGMTVQTTGQGQTRGWKHYQGTILYFEGNAAHVMFERSGLGERVVDASEIMPIPRHRCPCASCEWSREHHS